MCKIINELLKKSTKEVDPDTQVWVFSEVDHYKFTTLLIKECAAWIDRERGYGGLYGNDLKEYFGLK